MNDKAVNPAEIGALLDEWEKLEEERNSRLCEALDELRKNLHRAIEALEKRDKPCPK